MLRFPISCEISQADSSCVPTDQVISNLKLNEDWEVKFMRPINAAENVSIEICRQKTSDEVLVSGEIFCRSNNPMTYTKEFSKLMEPGDSSVNVSYNLPAHATSLFGNVTYLRSYNLAGIVYITSSDENSSYGAASGECKNCKSLMELSKDFERLLTPELSYFTDASLTCDSVSIPVHKSILSARSTVFAAMFTTEMKENRENQVNITDMEASVVQAMVTFMYTGNIILTVDLASDLLFAGDKYQLDDLKRVCCDFLKQNVCLQNVLRMLVLGDMIDEDLKNFAEDYICKMCTDFSVLESKEEWKSLRKERPNLVNDVLTSLVKSKEQKEKSKNPLTLVSRSVARNSRKPSRMFPETPRFFKEPCVHEECNPSCILFNP